MEIDHAMISTIILALPLIKEGQLSVTGESMCTSTGLWLRGLSLSREGVKRLTDWLDKTFTVLTGW